MKSFDGRIIPSEQVMKICQIIDANKEKMKEENIHLNEVLREDILPLLDRFCVVIYYPLNDKENNGFHTTYCYRGAQIHFVYINTNQHQEKQIFTAAHELGHFWSVDEELEETCGIKVDDDYRERLMNRFASELLMPEEIFRSYAQQILGAACDEGALTVGQMVEIITAIMNEFFVPYKAVVYRLYELELINEDIARLLWGDEDIDKAVIESYSKRVAKEKGYSRLYKEDGRKKIDGLKDLLDKAKEVDTVPVNWLKAFYSRFGFEFGEEDENLDSPIQLIESAENTNE